MGKSLTAKQVEALSDTGRHNVGDGLYLDIKPDGSKQWIFRYQLNGRRRNMGLGSHTKANGLAAARKKALDARTKIAMGIDPIDSKRQERSQQTEAAKATEAERLRRKYTFEICAKEWHKGKIKELSNPKHQDQVINTLRDYAFPNIGKKPVAEVTVTDVKKCLEPIWETKTETATRVRQRMESVFSYAITHGYRDTMNPAVWRGCLDSVLPKPARVKRIRHEKDGSDGHFCALPYTDVPEFMEKLRNLTGAGARALELTILTASRTGPIRLAKWSEFNLDESTWTIPASKMKAKREFRVALSSYAVELLRNLPQLDEYVFIGSQGKPISQNTMLAVLKRMGLRGTVTVHGFRSSFRDYIGEETGHPERLAEHALAHVISDATEAAYARGDQLHKRFALMEDWGQYVMGEKPANNGEGEEDAA